MSRREFLGRHDSREISELMAFDSAFGLGDGHQVSAAVCSTVASRFVGERCTFGDFAPIYKPADRGEAQTDQGIHDRLMRWAKGRGAVGA